jgi:hypothetical protein
MQSALIIGLMFLSVAAKFAALSRVLLSRLTRRYPVFAVMTGFSAVRSVVLLGAGGWAARLHPYVEIWRATQTPTLILETAVCLEAFWIVALHFRNVKIFGTGLLVLISLIGAGLSYALVAVWGGWWHTPFTTAAILVQRVGLALVLTGWLTAVWFRQFPTVPIKPNALRHLAILTILFGSFFVSGFFAQGDTNSWRFLANLVINLGTVLAFGFWAVFMIPAGESIPFEAPPSLSEADFNDANERDRERMLAASPHAKAMRTTLLGKRPE